LINNKINKQKKPHFTVGLYYYKKIENYFSPFSILAFNAANISLPSQVEAAAFADELNC
jgi:hypothetical protein